MVQKKLSIALMAAISMLAAPVYASTSASASLTNISVSLYSTDGGATFINFTNMPYSNQISLGAQDYSSILMSSNGSFGTADSSVTVSSNDGLAAASGSVTGTNNGTTFPTSVMGSSSAIGGPNNSTSTANTYIAAPYTLAFTLSPNTIAVFSAQGSAYASTTVGANINNTALGESSTAMAELRVFGDTSSSGYQTQQSTAEVNAYAGFTINAQNQWLPQTSQQTGLLAASFANLTGSKMTGTFSSNITTSSTSNISAVPEPGEWALMLSGIGLMGFMVSRKKSA